MVRFIFLLALLIAGGLFLHNLSGHMDQVANNYNTDNIDELLQNMEAPAAGGLAGQWW